MGMEQETYLLCDGCGVKQEISGSEYEGDWFAAARNYDWWGYPIGTYVCNDCLHLGPWLFEVDKEQFESGKISDDQLVEVLDNYPDPDDEEFPDYFCVPENLDLSDEMIESIASKIKGCVVLPCLTTLSDAAAESLGKQEGGDLGLGGLTELSDAALELFSKREGWLGLDGLTSLSDAAAESLGKREGRLFLRGLTELSDAAAESLSKHKGDLFLDLDNLPDSAAQILRDAGHG